MNEDVVQWLNEIRTLKQQLAEVRQERDEAVSREVNWRKLYATEAQQRRAETQLAQAEIQSLKEKLQHPPPEVSEPLQDTAAVSADIAQLKTVAALQAKLQQVIQERDRALRSLQQEQENHAQTRKSLTAVISDTIDQIAKQRQQESGGQE